MLRKYLTLFFLLICFAVSGQDKALTPYINFLEKQKTNPVDYVFELFKKYDIVILGERDHRDTTQYILIKKIMSDPRFIQNVGHVFTEVGTNNQADNANNVLKGNYASDEDFTEALRNLYRNFDWNIIWEKYSYWYFLNSIYQINKNIPQNEKITLYPLDVSYDWNECQDTVARNNFYKKLENRDYRDTYMGYNIIRRFNQILQDSSEHRKKALVILNSRHSYHNYICVNKKGESYHLKSAADFVFDYYPDQVANVLINWYAMNDSLIADGKWDATFHFLKNPSLGFNMEGSPFGNDFFDDYYIKPANDTRYKDIYTGFIFYLPLEDLAPTVGIPDIVTEDFYGELMRRKSLTKDMHDWSLGNLLFYFNKKRAAHIKTEELTLNLKKWKVE